MNKLPCLPENVCKNLEIAGMLYGSDSNYKIGKPQPIFVDCIGMIFTWIGQVDKYGMYIYKNFKKIEKLNIIS